MDSEISTFHRKEIYAKNRPNSKKQAECSEYKPNNPVDNHVNNL